MRLISWNVAGRQGTQWQQMVAMDERAPDVIALQEVTLKTVDRWVEYGRQSGFQHFHESCEPDGRKNFNVVMSRWPLKMIGRPEVPYRERVLSCSVRTPFGPVHLHNVHIPDGSSHKWRKIDTFVGLRRHLERGCRYPRVVCGDFNSPAHESRSGKVTPFWPESAEWGGAELSVITGLEDLGLPDVFRRLNGYGGQHRSWVWRRAEARGGGRLTTSSPRPCSTRSIVAITTGGERAA